MKPLEEIVWADRKSFTCYGVRVGIRVNDKSVLPELVARLPPGSKPSTAKSVDHLYSIVAGEKKAGSKARRPTEAFWNDGRIARARLADIIDFFESHVQLSVAEFAPRRVFVHAGVVGWKNRAILIPGMSHSGKTTLVNQLIRAGATYYSDEYAVLDAQGRVHPYARPLGVRTPNSSISTKVRAEDLGAKVGSKPLRVELVVSTSFKKGARWRPRPISRGEGVLELMANTVSARTQPELALSFLPRALASAQILKGPRGEASQIVESILERLA